MARVFGIWHNGTGTGLSCFAEMATHGETWESLAAAKADMRGRVRGERGRGNVVDIDDDGRATVGAAEDSCHPMAGDHPHLDVYHAKRVNGGWLISDELSYRLVFGPRGGINREN